jgi:DNA-binding CsgD family transcriptional regulator/PAS domain-containing protein
MTLRAEALSHLLDAVYAAAVEPQRWPDALGRLCATFGANSGGLFVQDKGTGAFSLAALDSQSPLEALGEYLTYYGAIDEVRDFARSRPPSELLTETPALEDPRIRRGECYNDFYRRWKRPHWVGSLVVSDEQHEGSFVIYRGPREGTFTTPELAAFELVVPHVRRAAEIGLRLAAAGAATAALAASLDQITPAVLVLERAGKVLWANRAAAEMLRRGDGIAAPRGVLTGATSAESARLRRAIAAAASPELVGTHPTSLALSRSAGGNYSAVAAPLQPSSLPGIPPTAAVLLLISDPEADRAPLVSHLRQVYGLTTAEAGLTVALLAGKTLQEIAAERQTSVATARSQLKAVLHKTGARRQAELVSMLLAMPAALLRRSDTGESPTRT